MSWTEASIVAQNRMEMVLLCRDPVLHQVQGKGWSPQDYMEVVR
jgi:hypothetical protein